MITNGDNLYSRALLSYAYPEMKNETGIIGFHFVSHHNWPEGSERTERGGRDVLLRTRLQKNWVEPRRRALPRRGAPCCGRRHLGFH